MKTIVIPTDFSSSAENAMFYAAQLAQTITANIILLNVYQIPVSMNEGSMIMIPAEELKNSSDAGLDRTKKILQEKFPAINITTQSRLGDITDELNDVCEKANVFAIVAGRRGENGVETFLFGSTSLSISRHAKVPVITVSDSFTSNQIKNIALAIDDSGLITQQQKIKLFMDELKAQLHVLHVQTNDEETKDFNAMTAQLNSSCTIIKDEEFVHGIQSYVQQNNIDLLIILPHKHSLMERLFFKTHTKELMQKIPIPIMCINESVYRES